MSISIPTRFTENEIATIDRLVRDGVADNRSAVIRRALELLADAHRRRRLGEAITTSYQRLPQSADDDALAMANAIAMTEAEPW